MLPDVDKENWSNTRDLLEVCFRKQFEHYLKEVKHAVESDSALNAERLRVARQGVAELFAAMRIVDALLRNDSKISTTAWAGGGGGFSGGGASGGW
jgi:uncharacterized membrane protein YgcG